MSFRARGTQRSRCIFCCSESFFRLMSLLGVRGNRKYAWCGMHSANSAGALNFLGVAC
jgi:hypothetical protein